MKTTVVNLFAGPGAGKCHAKGTKILLHDGTIKAVEDIVVGDKLMGPDSTPRNVLKLSRGTGCLYEVRPVKGEPYKVTGNHVLPLKFNANGKETDVFISVEDFLTLPKWKRERLKQWRIGTDFSSKTLSLEPYFLGLWLGDGSKDDQRITNPDVEVLNYLENYAARLNLFFRQHSYTEKTANTYSLSTGRDRKRTNEVLDKLRLLNVINNKHIPLEYKISSRKDRLQLLAGLLDTDGYYDGKCFEIITRYKELAEDILFICRSLGLAAYCGIKVATCQNNFIGSYYRIHISGHLEEIPTLIQRKQPQVRQQIKSVLRTGITVTPVGIDSYYGFEVDKDSLYLLGDFTVTHNSTIAASIFSNLKWMGIDCELVTEYAKDKVWQEHSAVFDNQVYLFAKQYYKLSSVVDKVPVVVTDAPLLLPLVYQKVSIPYFKEFVLDRFFSFNNINFFLDRGAKEYKEVGRNQTAQEAVEIDKMIQSLLDNNDIAYEYMPWNVNKFVVDSYITNIIMEHLLLI